ncbi:helix-turn-helix transcriptional regulator [Paenibacillus yanchengensis]|uniref:Helix-turn-helix transcriptional regulator n=1 Tax=Paenibacillus yanchengensis TaxID=2035833 RepID=A0ABW4YHS1_9BACL
MKNNIKNMRAKYNLTQDELAERLEVSRQTIISIEKERYNPSITLAFKLARVFNCQIEDIFIYEEG